MTLVTCVFHGHAYVRTYIYYIVNNYPKKLSVVYLFDMFTFYIGHILMCSTINVLLIIANAVIVLAINAYH